MTLRPGTQTTEFWLTLATNLAVAALTIADALPAETAAKVVAVANAVYAISRAISKAGTAEQLNRQEAKAVKEGAK